MESSQQAHSVSSSDEFTVSQLSVLKMSPLWYYSGELSVSVVLVHIFTGYLCQNYSKHSVLAVDYDHEQQKFIYNSIDVIYS